MTFQKNRVQLGEGREEGPVGGAAGWGDVSMVYILEKAGSRRRKETVTGTTPEEPRW